MGKKTFNTKLIYFKEHLKYVIFPCEHIFIHSSMKTVYVLQTTTLLFSTGSSGEIKLGDSE